MNRFVFIVALVLIYSNVCAARDVDRIETKINRVVPVYTAENSTPYFRWSLYLRHSDGSKYWVPQDCVEAKNEIENMVSREYLLLLGSALRSPEVKSLLNAKERVDDSTLAGEVDEVISKKFPGEDGFLDNLVRFVTRNWAYGEQGEQRVGFVRSCEMLLGQDDTLWYRLFFNAALDTP